MSQSKFTVTAVVALVCLSGCSTFPLQKAEGFSLPAVPDRASELSLQSGVGAAVPAFPDAFNGYVGSVNAVGPLAAFNRPTALAFLPDGTLFVGDGPCLRRIAPDAQGRQTVSTVAGSWDESGTADGPLSKARFTSIGGMAALPDGSLVVGDGCRIRRIVFDGHGGGEVSTIAGAEAGDADGDGAVARFYWIMSLASSGGKIFVAEANRIRQIDYDPVSGRATVTTFYAEGVYNPEAFNNPQIDRVAAVDDQTLWVSGNGKVRRLRRGADGKGAPDLLVVGNEPSAKPGEATMGPFGDVRGLALLPNGEVLVVAVVGTPSVRRISLGADGQARVSLVARPGPYQPKVRYGNWLEQHLAHPDQLAVGPHGEIRVLDSKTITAIELDAAGNATLSLFAGWPPASVRQDGPASPTSLHPQAMVANGRGGYYIASWEALYEMELTPMGGATTRLLAGGRELGKADGVGEQARFDTPNALLVYPDGSLIVSDYQNLLLRRVSFGADGKATVSTLAGGGKADYNTRSLTLGDGPALSAALLPNRSLCLGPDGTIYFGDRYRLRKLARDAAGQWRVTSLAGCSNIGIEHKDGPGEQARFGFIGGLAIDRDGSIILADVNNHLIRKVVFDAAGEATVSTLAGKVAGTNAWNTASGYKDGPASEALFKEPYDVDIAADGSLLITDSGNSAIRRIAQDPSGAWQVTTVVGPGEGMQDGPFPVARLYFPVSLEPDGPGKYLCLDGHSPTRQIRTIRMGVNP